MRCDIGCGKRIEEVDATGQQRRFDMTDFAIRTLEGGTKTIPAATLTTLRGKLRGSAVLPGEEGYDSARTIWNAMIDRRPGLIVRCLGAADVMLAVQLARAEGLLLSVRGGGHNIAG